MFHVSHAKQYDLLSMYVRELKITNLNETAELVTFKDGNGLDRFQKIYIYLGAMKEGFIRGCKRFIGLDGIFLRGLHYGILVTLLHHMPTMNDIQ